jgi:hypothetical protein
MHNAKIGSGFKRIQARFALAPQPNSRASNFPCMAKLGKRGTWQFCTNQNSTGSEVIAIFSTTTANPYPLATYSNFWQVFFKTKQQLDNKRRNYPRAFKPNLMLG